MKIYCFKCKDKTDTLGLSQGSTKGRPRISGTCTICGTSVSKFGTLPTKVPPKIKLAPVIEAPVEQVLTPVGKPIPLGNLNPGDKFEVGGVFFTFVSTGRGYVYTTGPTMGTSTLVRKAQGG